MDALLTFKMAKCVLEELPALWQVQHDDFRKVQSRRLRAMVKHAYENVELYREKYQSAGVKPEDVQTLADIEKLPIISKDDIINYFPSGIKARNIGDRDCYLAATSGSTGKPVRVYKDRTLVLLGSLAPLLIRSRLGKQVKLGRHPSMMSIYVTNPDAMENMLADIMERTRFLKLMVSSYHKLNALDTPYAHLEALSRHRPDIILTYPSILRNMATVAREEGLAPFQPKVMMVSAEMLDEKSRQVISSVFRGEVLNCYAATEVGVVAMECWSHQGLHIRCAHIIVEVLKDGKPVLPGVSGNVVVTHLSNRSTPIIRYSGLGDIAVFSPNQCTCGSRLPVLQRIEGRIADSVVLPDGRLIHPFNLTLALEHMPMINQFQIVQETVDRLRVLIMAEKKAIPDFGPDGYLRLEVVRNLRMIIGEGVDITVDLVTEIPRTSEAHWAVVRSLVRK